MKMLIALALLSLGGSLGASAAEQEPAAAVPHCQTFAGGDGATGLVCDNLSNEQTLSIMNQDLTADRRCYRVCSFRAGPICVRYRLQCDRWDGGGRGDGGGWGNGGGRGDGGGRGNGHGRH